MTKLALDNRMPLTFLVMEGRADPDGWRPWFELTRQANAAGANLRPQVGSRCFGVLLGHQSRLNPFKYAPTYIELMGLPFDVHMARLHDPSVREAILREAPVSNEESTSLDRMSDAVFANLFPLGAELEYEPTADQSVAAIAAREGRDAWTVMYDLLLGADGNDFLLRPLLNFGRGSYDGLYEMMRDPLTLQGLGDGGAHSAIICDASMTTYMLSHWVRDRTRGPRLELEYAVHRLTKDVADFYALSDRGVVRPGARADLNVIDLDRLRLRYPERVTDLPGGAGRLIQRSDGYVATIVAGETVVDRGELTDARPGRVVRSEASRTAG